MKTLPTDRPVDFLDDLFDRLPAATPPDDFRDRLMKRIETESIRLEKRKERYGLYSIIAASIALIGIAALICYWLLPGKPAVWLQDTYTFRLPAIRFPELSDYLLPLFIGSAVPVLLGFDLCMRRLFRKYRQKTSSKEL